MFSIIFVVLESFKVNLIFKMSGYSFVLLWCCSLLYTFPYYFLRLLKNSIWILNFCYSPNPYTKIRGTLCLNNRSSSYKVTLWKFITFYVIFVHSNLWSNKLIFAVKTRRILWGLTDIRFVKLWCLQWQDKDFVTKRRTLIFHCISNDCVGLTESSTVVT